MKRQLTIGLFFCILPAAVLVISCAKQEASSAKVDPSGVYALISVDGSDVPATVSHEGASIEVRSGTFTINADGTCKSKTVFVPPAGGEVDREVSATYTRTSSTLTMQWEGAGKTEGTLDGDTFTMDNEGMVFVYRK